VYSSPLERCWETAEIVAARHRQMRVREATGLLEVDYGRWANRTFPAVRRTALWRTVQRWPSAAEFPDGESIRRVQVRAVEEIESLRSKHPRERICCVSHADVIKLVVAHYLGVHVDLFQRIVVEPGSLSVLGIGEEGPALLALNTFGRIGRE
jgi:broad specificity phosphatase PhoE